MPPSEPGRAASAADVEQWLQELSLVPTDRAEREGIHSWDLDLDGRRRFDVPVTLILDPALALVVWVHFAPPIGDGFRRSYRKLLRWNDEFPFVKFAVAEDERPVLTMELPVETLDRDALGAAIARLLAICDQLLEDSADWLWIGGRIPPRGDRVSRQVQLFARYADQLGELAT
ncbi:MAG TPA: YbjN domain-containing protein [Candidatus Limnocylindrales bacterium]|nr:YbjN domain-containing protein [Candidatus Limnocylindrales bacterium]